MSLLFEAGNEEKKRMISVAKRVRHNGVVTDEDVSLCRVNTVIFRARLQAEDRKVS